MRRSIPHDLEHMLHAMDLGLAGKGVLVTGGGAASVRQRYGPSRPRVPGGDPLPVERRRGRAARGRDRGIPLQADLTDEAAADALIPAAVEALGRLDVCVANAGVWSTSRCRSSTCR